MITINASSTALTAQNNLNDTQKALSNNMLQLSTGKRINSAADDAAGLQACNRMETQISGMDQAQRNANDAISLAQTAEGAMQETTDVLNRTRDLALQSANDTNTEEDRAAIQLEAAQLKEEVDDIATHTNYGGMNLLDGSADHMTFQVGPEANQTVSFGIDAMGAADLKGEVVGVTIDSLIQTPEDTAGIGHGSDFTDTLKITPAPEIVVDLSSTDLNDEQAVMEAINAEMDGTDIVAGLDADGKISLTGFDLEGNTVEAYSKEHWVEDRGEKDVRLLGSEEVTTTIKSVDQIDISSQTGAQEAVQILDGALDQVSEQRSELGAAQNRLESKIDNLSNMEENLSAAQSQMMDADFAEQTTEMTSNQMLMQSGSAVLGQIKGMPQYASQLMG